MKTLVYLIFDTGNDRRDEMIRIATESGCPEGIEKPDPYENFGGLFSHTFDSTDPRLDKLKSMLRERGVKWTERQDAKYTAAELKSFPLLALWVMRQPVRGGGGQWGTEYDYAGACPECGSGAVQTSPLILPANSVPETGQIVTTRAGEILVAEPLTSALRETAVMGLELRQVVARRTQEPLPWWQIISKHEMPRMAPQTRGIVRESCWTEISSICTFPPPCSRCGRDGHYRTIVEPMQIVYRRTDVDLASVPNVAHTWEQFGHSVLTSDPARYLFPGYAQPLILIKQTVFDIFRQMKVKRLCFDPVRIEALKRERSSLSSCP